MRTNDRLTDWRTYKHGTTQTRKKSLKWIHDSLVMFSTDRNISWIQIWMSDMLLLINYKTNITDVFYLIIKWDRIHKLWDYNPYPKWNVMIVVWMITSSILRKYYLPMGEVIKNPVTQTKGKGVICLPKGTPGNRYSWLSV